jgi:hypothetical protein
MEVPLELIRYIGQDAPHFIGFLITGALVAGIIEVIGNQIANIVRANRKS